MTTTTPDPELLHQVASDLRDCAAAARHLAHQVPPGYVDLQSLAFLVERDLERQADKLDELVAP